MQEVLAIVDLPPVCLTSNLKVMSAPLQLILHGLLEICLVFVDTLHLRERVARWRSREKIRIFFSLYSFQLSLMCGEA